jgi:acyl carrier protein
LDKWMEPAAIGVRGELWIGGDGLARGYLGRGGQTAQSFQPDWLSGKRGARLYRTGDLVRYRANGDLEFLRRTDGQVKLRGFRIELGEIEAALMGHPSVREAVVLAREDEPGQNKLVAYLTYEPGAEELKYGQWRSYLKQQLPDYMLPSVVMKLEHMPLNNNGKLDRRALPAPDRTETDKGFCAPRNSIEEILTGIWCELLFQPQIGIHDNFFELGGHSLFATQMINQVREIFQVDIPLRAVFEEGTVAGLAALIEKEQQAKVISSQ